MRTRLVRIGPLASADIGLIGDYIAHFVSPLNGEQFLARLMDFVLGLDIASERGTARDDIHPGIRVVPFERSANLAILIEDEAAVLIRVFYRGQNWERELRAQFRSRKTS